MAEKNFCVIGSPIKHSLSPLIHNTLYDIYGLDYSYDKIEVAHDTLPCFINSLSENNIHGFNVTMPLKYDVSAYTNIKDTNISTNTVAVKNGKLFGYSTDEDGFYMSVKEKGHAYKNANIVFIGGGAVCSALAMHAHKNGAKNIHILNRTLEKAEEIALKCSGYADSFAAETEYESIKNCDILINTTPLGMENCGNFNSFDFLNGLKKDTLVCDLIYKPFKTSFLQKAEQNGNDILNGLPMLIWQAFYAFDHFCGIMPTKEDKKKVLDVIRTL